jgi:DNA-binding response OmpR family regulator
MPIAVADTRNHAEAVTTRRVLVVEDDTDVRGLIADVLSATGVEVEVASDAFGARQVLRSGKLDAVVLDIGLPGLSGLHICREIRRDPGTTDLPVIMMTGDTRPDARLAGERAGATAHLVKPLHLRHLMLQLRAVW